MTETSEKLSLGQIAPIPFSHLSNKPTTINDYGITDAYNKTESDNRFVRYDGAQGLSASEQLQARNNIGVVNSLGGTVTTLTRSTGILFSTGSTITSSGTISFDIPWGDDRYHNRLGIINSSSIFQFLGNVEGIQVRTWTSGSSGFPNELGSGIFIYTGSNSLSSAMGRTLGLIRTYNTENYYLGSSTTGGSTNPWRLIYHSGNFNPSSYQTTLGFTPENVANKATTFVTLNNTLYPTTSAVATNFVSLATEQAITGLKYFRRGTTSEQLHTAFDYPDNSGEHYNLRLYNNGAGNNVKYYFKQQCIVGTNNVDLDLPVLGFKNWVTLIGTDDYPLAEIDTYYDSQTNPAIRYPLSLYVSGDAMLSGRVYAGKNNFTDTSFLDSGDTLYSEGTVYAKGGLRTPNPVTDALDGTSILLGEAVASAPGSATHTWEIKINGTRYKIALTAVNLTVV